MAISTPPPHLRAFTGGHFSWRPCRLPGARCDHGSNHEDDREEYTSSSRASAYRAEIEVKQQQGALHAQWRVQPAWQYYLQQLGLLFLLGLGVTQLFAAWVFTQYVDGLDYATALWHCWVTSTTVGYGDVALTKRAEPPCWRRPHSGLCLVVGVALYSRADVIRASGGSSLQGQTLCRSSLIRVWIDLLDRDGRGSVDKVEFVIGLLSVLGLELCGEPLSFENDVQPLLERFDALDSDSSGALSREDLDYMIKESRRSRYGRVVIDRPARWRMSKRLGRVGQRRRRRPQLQTGVGQSGR